jgi:6-phosphogluconolactonase (cycloisomerase 2 family)
VPSIAISEIVKISEKKYVVASMKDKSLYFFEINEKRQVLDLKRVEVYERIRDLRFHGENNQLYLFMEDTASIGLINLN